MAGRSSSSRLPLSTLSLSLSVCFLISIVELVAENMKFGTVFAAQMAPEWREAYMNYNYLKSLLKQIIIFKQKNNPKPLVSKRNLALYRTFSGLTTKNGDDPKTYSGLDIESQDIFVHRDEFESCTTTFLVAADEGAELEHTYFRMIDREFNKVEKFYRSKMDEMMDEATILNEQLHHLVAIRMKVEKTTNWSEETPTSMASTSARRYSVEMKIEEDHMTDREECIELIKDEKENKKSKGVDRNAKTLQIKSLNGKRPPPLQLPNHVELNDWYDIQRSTPERFFSCSDHRKVHFDGANLKKVEKQLKKALVVFYQKLKLLKDYSFLNSLAFSKIMKKYDKITSRNSAKSYMNMVDNSCIGISNEVMEMMERVEATFIKQFCNSNRRKGMQILRPKTKNKRHKITFFSGLFAGCTFALLLAVIIMIQARYLMDEEDSSQNGDEEDSRQNMEAIVPLYSLFGFLILHILMYSSNLYFWIRYRVNYSFILEFKRGTELCFRDVSLLGFSLAVLALGCLLLNLDIDMDPATKEFKPFTEILPLGLAILLITIVLCPLNIIYRSSRFFFVSTFFRCIFSPLFKVKLSDFFLAEQLTSQVQTIRNLKFYICYYKWRDEEVRQSTCSTNTSLNTLYFAIAIAPYLFRLLQCLRRLVEEKDRMQGCNGLKYLITIVAICFRTAYSLNNDMSCKMLALGFSVVAAIYSTYWDVVVDWGLLQGPSKKHWLRDRLLVPHKSIYFVAMGLNASLRFAWLQTVMDFKLPFLYGESFAAAVAALEIIRRGMWNFFSLEKEHLNNVAKYRAIKSVPLPFEFNHRDGQRKPLERERENKIAILPSLVRALLVKLQSRNVS